MNNENEKDKAIVQGIVRVAQYHGLPKNEWMAKVVPGVEEVLGAPLSVETVDKIHECFKDDVPPDMAIEEICFPPDASLEDQVTENMAICAGMPNEEQFRPQAKQLLASFEATEGRPPKDYLEVEQWSLAHLDEGGRFLVIGGGKEKA